MSLARYPHPDSTETIRVCDECRNPTDTATCPACDEDRCDDHPCACFPATLDDAHLIPALVAVDYGDLDAMNSPAWPTILEPMYAERARFIRALVEREVTSGKGRAK